MSLLIDHKCSETCMTSSHLRPSTAVMLSELGFIFYDTRLMQARFLLFDSLGLKRKQNQPIVHILVFWWGFLLPALLEIIFQ